MKFVDLIDSKRIARIPDKTINLMSSGNFIEQGFCIKQVELRLYQEQKDNDRGPYSIITTYVETNNGSIERIFERGYLGPNAIEEAAANITSHPTMSTIILNSLRQLKFVLDKGHKNSIELRTNNLLDIMKKKGFLTSKKVEDAIKNCPRHLFVSKEFVEDAYEDIPLLTKNLQTISQPSVVARMTEWLDVQEGNKILEVGSGSGWQSAILSRLVGNGKIYSVERFEDLATFAKNNHEKIGIRDIEIICGDGTMGIPQKAPFDRIIITAACPNVPKPLLDQLAINGLVIAPVGRITQTLVLLKKTPEKITEVKKEYGYQFIPLVGKHGFTESLSA